MTNAARIAFAAALVATPLAHARDGAVAKLVNVAGNVLVSSESSIASAGEALRLAPGMRVLATANASAIIEYDHGCRVKVAAGERAEVRAKASGRPCAALISSVSLYAPVAAVPR